jgi:ribonuclease HII
MLFDVIRENAVSYCIASASVEEIDELNIRQANLLAMRRAIDGLAIKPDFALIDGNDDEGFQLPAMAVVKGDAKSMSISAASILAKVTRDRQCMELDALYPAYGFKGHKGYPTKEHMQKVAALGPCPEHRKTFLKFLDKMKDENN